jgi:hypothetical protein
MLRTPLEKIYKYRRVLISCHDHNMQIISDPTDPYLLDWEGIWFFGYLIITSLLTSCFSVRKVPTGTDTVYVEI